MDGAVGSLDDRGIGTGTLAGLEVLDAAEQWPRGAFILRKVGAQDVAPPQGVVANEDPSAAVEGHGVYVDFADDGFRKGFSVQLLNSNIGGCGDGRG